MAKPLYLVGPNDGKLYRFDGVMWTVLVNSALPGFLDAGSVAGGPSQTCGSHPAPFVWRGRLWVAYYTITEGVRYRFVEVIGLGGTPSYDTANTISVDPSEFGLTDKTKTIFSNFEYYRGMVVRMAFPEDSNDAYAVVFDDFAGTGSPQVRIMKVDGVPTTWTSWETGAATGDADPHGGGFLFPHDQTLFWSPRGAFDHTITKTWERLFRIDIRDDHAGMSVIAGLISAGQATYPEWTSTTGTPSGLSSAQSLGMSRCSLAAGSVNGKLFTVNANGTVDVIDDLSNIRTRAFDLRDNAAHLAASGLSPLAPTSGAPAQIRFARGDTPSPGATTDDINLCGGRVDIVAGPRSGQKFDVVGLFRNGASPASSSPIELKLVNPTAGTLGVALTPADQCDVRYGFLGSAFSTSASLRGSPCAVQCVTKGGYAYIVTGARKTSLTDGQGTAPLMITKWDGQLPASVSQLVISASASVSGLDVVIDEDADLLHVLYHDFATGLISHVIVNLATFTVANQLTAFTVTGGANVTCGVGPGAAFAFSTFEPTAEMVGSPVFDPLAKTVTIDYKLWTQMPGGLTNVSFKVEYNVGDGWQLATAHATSGPTADLAASAAGTSHVYVHALGTDLPAFIGSIQYRLTTFIP